MLAWSQWHHRLVGRGGLGLEEVKLEQARAEKQALERVKTIQQRTQQQLHDDFMQRQRMKYTERETTRVLSLAMAACEQLDRAVVCATVFSMFKDDRCRYMYLKHPDIDVLQKGGRVKQHVAGAREQVRIAV